MEMMKKETWNDQDGWRLLSKTRPPRTIGDMRLDEDVDFICSINLLDGIHHLKCFSFSNLSITSPTSKLILQPFRRFTYVTAHYPTLPLLHLRHSSFSNPSFASSTSQALHLIHMASRP